MNTPAHVILAAAVLAQPHSGAQNWAVVLGALAPDLSLYLLVAWAVFVQGHSPSFVFNELYFSQSWQQVFAIDNSVFVWGGVLALGLALGRAWIWALALAALMHLAGDLPLHHDDGRPHFWPLSDWVFMSPLSYWDPKAYGRVVGALEAAVCLVLLAVLWRRFPARWVRALLGLAAVSLIVPGLAFALLAP